VDFAPYDNDGNGFVDAFVVVHAGRGAEETGSPTDIWSHKWVLPQQRDVGGGTNVFGYLTIPEDAKLGVCAHELGHLVFGWPDLYDDDSSSRGIGDFCLMAGGSWGLGGKRPVHPSAWCKASQGWVRVTQLTSNRSVTVRDVKDRGSIYRLWRNGADGSEYFLVENRQKGGYDQSMPAQGLLVWHIDDAVDGNSDERHYQVALEQADGRRDLEANRNDGDAGDPFPGASRVTTFDDSSTPSSRSYGDLHTCVAIEGVPANNVSMKVRMRVKCTGPNRHQ
jgi:immune inhibitor A